MDKLKAYNRKQFKLINQLLVKEKEIIILSSKSENELLEILLPNTQIEHLEGNRYLLKLITPP